MAPLGDRIDARVDTDAQRTTGQLVDAARMPSLRPAPRHWSSVSRTCVTNRVMRPELGLLEELWIGIIPVQSGGPPGARTQNLRIKSPELYQLS